MKAVCWTERKQLTVLMRAADLFHGKKVLAIKHEEDVPMKTGMTDEQAARVLMQAGAQCETAQHRLVAVQVGTVFACLPDTS